MVAGGEMRQILVYRHAKTEKSDGDVSDRQRRLLPRGQRQCESIGELLKEHGLEPDLIVTSPALRARETARRTAEAAGLRTEITDDERLYEATPRTYLSIIQDLPDTAQRVMLVGHNPGAEEFIDHATGKDRRMKTGNLAVLESDLSSWASIAPETRFSLKKHLEPDE
jgi:phosphohistidine phosphatase